VTPIRRAIATLVGVISMWAAPVSAQVVSAQVQGASNAATAEALYDQARARLKAGENARACALLEESQRLERAAGTALLLAHCYEALGRTASAWALFREVQSVAPEGSPRQQIARIRASALEPELATLIIELSPTGPLPNDLRIQRDAIDVPTSTLGIAVPVDPGRHAVTAASAGAESWSTTVDVVPGASTRVVIPPLSPNKLTPAQPVVAKDNGAPPLHSIDVSREEASTSHALPWVLTGLGAAGVLAGVTLSFTAHSKYAESDAHCRTRTLCDATGLEFRSSAETQAAWATGVSVVGAASLAAAGLLFVFDVGPNTAWHVQPGVTPELMSVSLGGAL
jgi:hypothetical protein